MVWKESPVFEGERAAGHVDGNVRESRADVGRLRFVPRRVGDLLPLQLSLRREGLLQVSGYGFTSGQILGCKDRNGKDCDECRQQAHMRTVYMLNETFIATPMNGWSRRGTGAPRSIRLAHSELAPQLPRSEALPVPRKSFPT